MIDTPAKNQPTGDDSLSRIALDIRGMTGRGLGGPTVLRVFAQYVPGGYPLKVIVSSVAGLISAARDHYRTEVDFVVLPAGVFRWPTPLEVPEESWRRELGGARAAVSARASALAATCALRIPMAFGADGDIDLVRDDGTHRLLPSGLQSIIVVEDGLANLSLKSLPSGASERRSLGVAFARSGSVDRGAFEANQGERRLARRRLMALVCHDVIALDRRGAAAAARHRGGWSDSIRRQMRSWMRGGPQGIALNAIHLLPRERSGRISPGFLQGQAKLSAEGWKVVSVCGVHRRPWDDIQRLIVKLRCDFPTVNAHMYPA